MSRRAISRGTIQGALPIVARAVGRKLDVSVSIGGHRAYTDGKHIQLPALPMDIPENELATLAFGYLEHEAAHVRYTDMEKVRADSPLHKMFTNIFEDVRIEKALGKEYPGFAGDLRALTATLVERGEMGGTPDPDAPLAAKMGEYVLLRGRHDVLGPDELKEPAERAEKAFRDAVSPGLATRVGAALGTLRDLGSTREAADLARQVIRLVEEEEDEQRQQAAEPPQPGGGAGGGIPQAGGGCGAPGADADAQGDGNQGGGNDGPGDGNQGADGQTGGNQGASDGPGDGSGSESTGQCDGDGADAGTGGTGAGSGGGDDGQKSREEAAAMAEALRELLDSDGEDGPKSVCQAAAEALGEAAQQQPYRGESSGATLGSASKPFGESTDGRSEVLKVAGATVALRTRLQGLLQAEQRSRRRPARRGKRLDRRRLIRARMGDPRVFVNRTRGVAVNTAVQILLDRSGSMDGGKVELARESALACALALSEIQGVSLATAAFPGESRDEVIPVTRFGEPARRTAGRYASVYATGGTPMVEALLWAADELLVQREPRRMCLIVTDGYPNDMAQCTQAIRLCWAGGIEVMGIGIGSQSDAMGALFPVWTQVDTVDELAVAMFTMMREALTRSPSV